MLKKIAINIAGSLIGYWLADILITGMNDRRVIPPSEMIQKPAAAEAAKPIHDNKK